MANKINISIPKPCHENWQAMTAVEKGKFCNSCQKQVFDFTSSSDREIINAFEKNKNLCGRFLNTQLNRDLVKPKEKSSIWLATTTALISLIGVNEVTAQETPTEQMERKIVKDESIQLTNDEIEISGIVRDTTGPLPGTNIVIKGTLISTQTDVDGKYTLKVHKGDVLFVSFVGYNDIKYEIKNTTNANNINFLMEEDENQLITSAGMIIKMKKRTFFGRLFHKSKYRRC